jgi:hypothetical protein
VNFKFVSLWLLTMTSSEPPRYAYVMSMTMGATIEAVTWAIKKPPEGGFGICRARLPQLEINVVARL